MKISDFINTGFRDYAEYDNERSIADLMDGLKITERKVLFAFVDNIGYQTIVCDKAGMRAADLTHYKHGATSMIGVLQNMNQDFPGANNMPLFEKDGQFGTRLDHLPSSERYVSTKLSDTYKKLFDSQDNFILDYLEYQGDRIEPKFYLPKLPLLLINGSEGTGNGYASKVLPYHQDEIKAAVIEVLKTGKVQTKLTPYMNGYYGAISKNHETGQVTFQGMIERKGSNTIIITELTPSWQLATYKDHLNFLMTGMKLKNGQMVKVMEPLIKDYDNESTEEGWRFVLDVPRTTSALSDEELINKFNLVERVTENLTVWTPNGTLRNFASVEELIEYWVEQRLRFYEVRRLDQISRQNEELNWLKTKLKFIRHWNVNSQFLVTLKEDALKNNISFEVTPREDYVDRLLAIQVRNLGLEQVQALEADIAKVEKVIGELEALTNNKMMINEVKGLKL
jgi:DNA gyrase/topoisomerase IV subunit A